MSDSQFGEESFAINEESPSRPPRAHGGSPEQYKSAQFQDPEERRTPPRDGRLQEPRRSQLSDRAGRAAQVDWPDRPGQFDQSDHAEGADWPSWPDEADGTAQAGRSDRPERATRPDRSERSGLLERLRKPRKPERPERPEKPKKPYVGDYGNPIKGAKKVSTSIEMVALALVIGFVIGFLVFVALWLSSALTDLIWHNVTDGEAPWFMPIVLCTAGGLIIGLWTKYIGGNPEPLMKVMAQVRQTGSYRLKNIPASVVAFLLPLAFGGSVGLEAGLTGIIAAACSYIGRTLRAAGLRVKEVADLTVSASISAIFGTPLAGIAMASEEAMPMQDGGEGTGTGAGEGERPRGGEGAGAASAPPAARRADPNAFTFRRRAKVVLYCAAAFGSIGGMMLLTELTGGLAGIPHFDTVQATGPGLLWAIPCLLLAYAMTLIHFAAERGTRRLAAVMERFTVLKPLVVGVIIGCIGVVLPNVLFCGEEQGFEIQQNWQAVGVAVLLCTGLVKVAATSLCLNMGWHGGNFFPNIYAGISAGYGMALLTGADPMLCVTVVTSAYLGGMLRRPLIVLALLILCFPLRSIVWMGLACVIGFIFPLPAALRPPDGAE